MAMDIWSLEDQARGEMMSEELAVYGPQAEVVKGEVTAMVQQARAMVIASESDRTTAGDVLREAKRRAKLVIESFDEAVKTAHAAHKAAVAHRTKFLEPLQELERILKTKVEAYDQEQARLRAEAERKARAEAEAAAERERQRLIKEAEKLKTPELKAERIERAEAVVAAPIELPPEPEKREGESYATSYEVEITDAAAVPREYMIIDAAALRKVGNATKGKLAIPGVRWIEKRTLRVRV
jgi:tyrosyl-tRNA synthetase